MPTPSLAALRARLLSQRSGLRRSLQEGSRRIEYHAIEVTSRLPEPLRQAVLGVVRRARIARASAPWTVRTAPAAHEPVTQPQVSVVVTSCDRSELLTTALRSVQKQDVESWECIIVDDASTDDALLVAQSFAAVDARIRVVASDTRTGPSAARNLGLAAATAPLVCFLDDDDFLLDGSLRARLDAVTGQPDDVAGAYCDWVNVEPTAGLEHFRPPRRAPVRRGEVAFASLVAGTPFILSAPLVRTAAVRSVGGFDERLDRAEDAELWVRLCRLGYRFVDANHVGVAYRRSRGSLVTAAPERQLTALAAVFGAADGADPSVVGHGPRPVPEPLPTIAAAAARRGWILRYVTLVAASDPDRAVQLGEELLPAAVRRGIDPDVEAPGLAAGAAARLGLEPGARAELTAVTTHVLARLVPPLESEWTPTIDVEAWRTAVLTRATAVHSPVVPRLAATRAEVDGAVVLIPEARYHVDELGPLAVELRRRDVPVRFMVSPKTVPAALSELGRYAAEALPYEPDQLRWARAVVTLNDWGPLRDALDAAAAHGVATVAKVEGVQDFEDVESTWSRRPYRSAAVILAQGPNDVEALPEKDTVVVGSSRLERIWRQAEAERGGHALINVNFTFHVLTAQRDHWVKSVQEGVRRAGVPALVSRHPAERGAVFGLPVATKPFRHEITRAGLLVTRFSTVAFEAIARGVPFVYHNPHGERFPAFQRPDGAFPVSTDAGELAAAIAEVSAWRGYRQLAREFFFRQVDVEVERPSAERAADVVVKVSA